ncbi:hypothetical protein [Sphingomonas alpina]|uniref:Lipopolysaccharide biosynthesis protein n=1 Tax=Sphingomonas alpina TaxID=653931 RepID=A0A7H0LFX8_9SPHN|nr:hypothetical protein [Sphingomonas alpina]QNQ08581.1 hypothetical protein H3Z74_17780 [Sphingomonas alpina]
MTPLGLQYLRIVLSRWRLVFGLVIGCTLGAWLFSALVLANKPQFESASRLNIVPTSEELGYANRFVRGSTFDGGSVLLQTYAEFAHTRPIVEPIVDRYIEQQARTAGITREAWIAKWSVPNPWSPGAIYSALNYGLAPPASLKDQLIDAVIKYTAIETVEGTYLIRITVTWDDPQSAAWFSNALADAIIARAERMSRASGTQIAGSLTTKLDAKKIELATVIAQSRALKKSLGIVDIDRQKQSLLEARLGEQAQLTNDLATLKANQGQVAGLKRQSSGKLTSAQQVLEQTLAVEGPRGAGLQDGIAIRQRRIGDIDNQLARLGLSDDRVKTLDDRATALQAEVASLTERASFSEVENVANAPRIQLIERAVPPLVRSSPKMLLNTALGFLAGCALAGCALLLLGPGPVRPLRRSEDEDGEEDAVDDTPNDLAAPADLKAEAAPEVESDRPVHAYPSAAPAQNWTIRPGSAFAYDVAAAPVATVAPEPVDWTAEDPVARVADAVDAPPVVAERKIGDDHLFPQILPRPADAQGYDADEQAWLAPHIATWLADPLVADGRPILVASDAHDGDARSLYRLIYQHLRDQDITVRTFDATGAAAIPAQGEPGTKPLIYGGGLSESGSREMLTRAGGVDIVMAAGVDPGESAIARARACSRDVDGLVSRRAYVVAIGG